MDRIEELFNLAEAGLWISIAGIMAVAAFRHSSKKRQILIVATVGFALFGVSDLIEAETGSWWEPWWLLVLKISCVAILILALRAWLKLARDKDTSFPHPPTRRKDLR